MTNNFVLRRRPDRSSPGNQDNVHERQDGARSGLWKRARRGRSTCVLGQGWGPSGPWAVCGSRGPFDPVGEAVH